MRPEFFQRFARFRTNLSPGLAVIMVVTVVATLLVIRREKDASEGVAFWTFAISHHRIYEPLVEEWNATHETRVDLKLIHNRALERRMMSGFFAGTPVAGLIEANHEYAMNAWRGPPEAVGFVDLHPLLERDGLYDRINPPSLSPWRVGDHQYGLPHDVHPTLLTYRADLIEDQAGIDLSGIETWDQFMTALEPLLQDLDGDGRQDRFAIELPQASGGMVEILLAQGGGGIFNPDNELIIDSDRTVELVSRLAIWHGKGYAVDIPFGSGAGNKQLIDGVALAWITPDWRVFQSVNDLKALKGKLKLMPLPAWEEGGRRTSVWGATMLGLPKANGDLETRWQMAKHFYFSESAAIGLFQAAYILTPITHFWDNPAFHRPDPFFRNQKVGTLFIEQAPHVPLRSSTPFVIVGQEELGNAFSKLVRHVRDEGIVDPRILEPLTRELLAEARRRLESQTSQVARIQNRKEEGSIP